MTFDFTLDAFPGYTYFDKTKKVLCVIQIIDTKISGADKGRPVMPHTDTHEHDDIFNGNEAKKKVTEAAVPITTSLPTSWTKATDVLKKNQAATTVTQDGTDITVTTKPDEMTAWTSTDSNYADSAHKWVVLDIDTGSDDITQYKYNGTQLTASDVAEAEDVDLPAGHIDYWLNTDTEKDVKFTLSKGEDSTEYTIHIVHAS